MKKGTIFKNLWEGRETYFVYTDFIEPTGRTDLVRAGGYVVANYGREWRFERSIMYGFFLKDEKHFPIVGHIDFEKTLIDGILKAIEKTPEED